MAVRSRILRVTTTATPLVTNDDSDSNPAYRDVAVSNTSSVTLYLGGPDVTTTNGFPIAPGQAMSFDQMSADAIPHAVIETGTADVAVLELGV